MTFRTPPRPQLVAHKGNSWDYPENSRASVLSAIDVGVDVVEIDVSTTADGVPVVFHGPLLHNTTDVEGKVSRMPWSVLAVARARNRDGSVSAETVPRVEDLLRELGHRTLWNIDLKDDAAVGPVIEIVERLGIADRVVLSGSKLRRVRRVLGASRQVAVLLDLTRVDQFFALWPRTRRVWLCRRYHKVLRDPLVIGLNVNARYVDAVLVHCVHDVGAELWTFTVDDQARIDFLVALGVDSVTTNRPADLLVRRPQ